MCKSPKRPPPQPAATPECGFSPILVRARSDFPIHPWAAWFVVTLCSASFYLGPLVLLSPFFAYFYHPEAAAALLVVAAFLGFYPLKPWPATRRAYQAFYPYFDLHHNFTPELDEIARRENRLGIVAMHPHSILPLQGFAWVAICDQLLPNVYGYGCTTDGALVLPVLRHILRWVNTGSASKGAILKQMQQYDQNLFVLPGGVAEIFLSHRRKFPDDLTRPNTQTIKARRYGLMKLALETGAAIFPIFVFGASDMLDQLAPAPVEEEDADDKYNKKDGRGSFRDRFGARMERLSRKLGGGLTLFYGRWGTPVPHRTRMSMVMGDPVFPVLDDDTEVKNAPGKKRTCRRIENPTAEQVEELMGRYVRALEGLFEQYKGQAGYPNERLRIV